MSSESSTLEISASGVTEGDNQKEPDPDHPSVMSDPKSFLGKIGSLFNQQSLSDVKIEVGDRIYYAHKFLLANLSDVLRTMLYEERWSEESPNVIKLIETEDCQLVFEPFLKFLYTATIELNRRNVIGILCLADKYNVEALKLLCQSYMIDHCKSPHSDNIQNALIWYPWSKALQLKCLLNQSKATIAWNAKDIMTSPEWLSMEYDFLQDMLKSSDLVMQSELEVYEAVERWLLGDLDVYGVESFTQRAYCLLPLVRFPRMTIMELHTVEQSKISKQPGASELLVSLLGKAYRFHSLCIAPIKNIQDEFSDPIYQPRDYLYYQVDSVKIQNTLRYAMQVEVKTCSTPLPDNRRDAEWKLSYRKVASTGVWNLHIQCQDQALNSSNAPYESTVIVYNTSDKIIQVIKPERSTCRRGQTEVIDVALEDSNAAKTMVLLIKPVTNISEARQQKSA